MKNLYFTILLLAVFSLSCKKDADLIQANANFSIGGQFGSVGINYTDSVFVIGTHDELVLLNHSTFADSILWNFGNGKISKDNNTLLSYDSAGVYNVTLTAFNKTGTKSSYSRQITVKERNIKSLSINNFQLNNFSPNTSGLPVFTKADIWLEVKFSQAWDSATATGDILAPVIYRSPVFTNVDSGFHSSLTYTLPASERTIINYPIINDSYPFCPAGGRGTIVNIYAKDNSGTYLLACSYWSGLQIESGSGNPANSDNYTLGFWITGSTNTVRLNCAFKL